MTLEKASKVDLIRAFSNLSTRKIIEANYPPICLLNKFYKQETVEKVLAILVNDLTTAFEGELSHQAEELAIEINTQFRNITIEDVYLCFRDIKTSSIYGKLTQNKVLNALQNQFESRLIIAEEINYNKHLSLKYNTDTERTSKASEIGKHKAAHAAYYKQNNSKKKAK